MIPGHENEKCNKKKKQGGILLLKNWSKPVAGFYRYKVNNDTYLEICLLSIGPNFNDKSINISDYGEAIANLSFSIINKDNNYGFYGRTIMKQEKPLIECLTGADAFYRLYNN